jgi:Arsenical resistance operon protein ArsD
MKKQIITTALFILTAFTRGFANDDHGINKATAASFSKDFQMAKMVNWQKQNDYEIATFNLNGQIMMAYYNHENSLVAVLHHVSADHLPIFLLRDLKNKYSDYWVSELFEAATNGESHYYMTLENADQTLKLKSVNSTDWVVSKTQRKETM